MREDNVVSFVHCTPPCQHGCWKIEPAQYVFYELIYSECCILGKDHFILIRCLFFAYMSFLIEARYRESKEGIKQLQLLMAESISPIWLESSFPLSAQGSFHSALASGQRGGQHIELICTKQR